MSFNCCWLLLEDVIGRGIVGLHVYETVILLLSVHFIYGDFKIKSLLTIGWMGDVVEQVVV